MMKIVILKKEYNILQYGQKNDNHTKCRVDDLPGITEIYNEAVVNTFSLFISIQGRLMTRKMV